MSVCGDCLVVYANTDLTDYDCPVCKTHRKWDRAKIEYLRLKAIRSILSQISH